MNGGAHQAKLHAAMLQLSLTGSAAAAVLLLQLCLPAMLFAGPPGLASHAQKLSIPAVKQMLVLQVVRQVLDCCCCCCL
jgi:hypothetical protein